MSIIRCVARAYAVAQTRGEVVERVREATGPLVSLTFDGHAVASPRLITGEGSVDIGIATIEAVWDS